MPVVRPGAKGLTWSRSFKTAKPDPVSRRAAPLLAEDDMFMSEPEDFRVQHDTQNRQQGIPDFAEPTYLDLGAWEISRARVSLKLPSFC